MEDGRVSGLLLCSLHPPGKARGSRHRGAMHQGRDTRWPEGDVALVQPSPPCFWVEPLARERTRGKGGGGAWGTRTVPPFPNGAPGAGRCRSEPMVAPGHRSRPGTEIASRRAGSQRAGGALPDVFQAVRSSRTFFCLLPHLPAQGRVLMSQGGFGTAGEREPAVSPRASPSSHRVTPALPHGFLQNPPLGLKAFACCCVSSACSLLVWVY